MSSNIIGSLIWIIFTPPSIAYLVNSMKGIYFSCLGKYGVTKHRIFCGNLFIYYEFIFPVVGLLGEAESIIGIRPAKNAFRPAVTPSLNALPISPGFFA